MFFPDRVINPKFNKEPVVKPLLANQKQNRPPSVKYTRFGHNLGPSHPIRPNDKYRDANVYVQSPVTMAAKTRKNNECTTFLVN